MYQSLVFAISILLVAIIYFVFNKKSNRAFSLFLKIFTFAYCVVGFIRFLMPDSFIFVINGGWIDNVYRDQTDILQTILRWGYYLNYGVLPMAVFFDSRVFKNIASYICLPFSILSTVFFKDFMKYFLAETNRKTLSVPDGFRYAFFVLELVMAIVIPVIIQVKQKHYLNIKNKVELRNFLILAPCVILLMVPVYVPQSLHGIGLITNKPWDDLHITWLILLFALTLTLYHLFRFRNYRERYMLCIFLTIVLFYHYDSLYLMGFSLNRLPFQLCNIASYFFLICVPFKLKKMFNFCYIANTVGTMVALVAPDFSSGGLGFWNMHFIMEHSLVFIIPILCMGLRIFPRVDKRSILHVWVGFTLYFLFAFVMGTIINGYYEETGQKVNYFFMFDLKEAFDYFPMLTFTEKTHYELGRFEFYPLLAIIIYLAFNILCLAFYWLTKVVLYKLEDDHLQLRLSRIELYEKLTGKKSKQPKAFID